MSVRQVEIRPAVSDHHRTIYGVDDDARHAPDERDKPARDTPATEDQHGAPDPAEAPTSLRELIQAAESGEPVTLPPGTAQALVELQKAWARMLTPYLELRKHLAATAVLPPIAQQMADLADAVKTPLLPPEWPAAAKIISTELAAAYKPLIEMSDALQQQLAASRWPETMAALRQALSALPAPPHSYCPRNWGAHNWSTADIKAAMAILCDEGIPLAWVPRATIVAELVQAPDATSRLAILATRIPEIVEDCREVLNVITDPELKPLVDLSESALVALGTAPAAAQALAANIFETFLRDANRRGQMFGRNLGYFKTDKVIKQIAAVSDDTPVDEFRRGCVLTPALRALQSYNPETDPLPTEFGRHPTVHRAHPQHYTPANAVIAVMLAVSFLRQAQDSAW